MFPDISGWLQTVFHGKGSRGITSTEGTTEACVQKWPFSKVNFSPFIALPRYLKISERKTDERFLVDQEKSLIRP